MFSLIRHCAVRFVIDNDLHSSLSNKCIGKLNYWMLEKNWTLSSVVKIKFKLLYQCRVKYQIFSGNTVWDRYRIIRFDVFSKSLTRKVTDVLVNIIFFIFWPTSCCQTCSIWVILLFYISLLGLIELGLPKKKKKVLKYNTCIIWGEIIKCFTWSKFSFNCYPIIN